ncbi:hypothetical protein M3Y97_00175400 [Aphelenchoides bicaudatus]|nr:hypothetical protein M3Y97_00175400 [Aphelenchoides bicaudatus]
MTHKLERQLKGLSGRYNGYVLDNQQTDPTIETLHHVFCVELQRVFVLRRSVYDGIIKQIDQNRPNDKHRIEDAAFKAGDFIVFTFTNKPVNDCILDFERSENPMNLVFADGRDVFVSQCVFNNGLNRVFSEHFNHFNIDPHYVRSLPLIPTPNVPHICHIGYYLTKDRILMPELMRLVEIDADSHDFAQKAEWNKSEVATYKYDSDDDLIDYEIKEVDMIDAVPGQKGFITGLTSVFVPEKPSLTVVMPSHSAITHFIGHETQCDLIYNELIKCYVVFMHQPRISTHYHTLISRTRTDVTGLFYIELDLRDTVHGFYRHQQFRLVADPFGYLDVCRFRIKNAERNIPAIFKVPIRDRLGVLHEVRSTADLDIVTRFEVAGPGDVPEQVEAVTLSASKPFRLKTIKGVVINAAENRAFAYHVSTVEARSENFQGMFFNLPPNHTLVNGDHFKAMAQRVLDPDFTLPNMNLSEVARADILHVCTFKNGWFELDATYREVENCYENNVFGFIPCKKKPEVERPHRGQNRKRGNEGEPVYRIRVKENRNLPSQTIFCEGEFLVQKN